MSVIHESGAEVVNEALNLLRQDEEVTAAQLNGEDPTPLSRKCARAYESTRSAVLTARNWNFCRRLQTVRSVWDLNEHAFVAGVFGGAVRIEAVYGEHGEVSEGWELRADGKVKSSRPITRISYVEDVKNLKRWPALVRRAFAACLARDLAIPVTGRQNDLNTCNSLYQQALREASLVDARQNNPGPETWGRNHYADAISGRRRGHRPGCLNFDSRW